MSLPRHVLVVQLQVALYRWWLKRVASHNPEERKVSNHLNPSSLPAIDRFQRLALQHQPLLQKSRLPTRHLRQNENQGLMEVFLSVLRRLLLHFSARRTKTLPLHRSDYPTSAECKPAWRKC